MTAESSPYEATDADLDAIAAVHAAQELALARDTLRLRTEALHRVTSQRDEATKALWDVWEALGFDTDGDTGPQHLIAGMGRDGFASMVVRDAVEHRRTSEDDYAADTDALEARAKKAESALVALRSGIEAYAAMWDAREDEWTTAHSTTVARYLRDLLAPPRAPSSPTGTRAAPEGTPGGSEGCGCYSHPDRRAHRFGDPAGCYCECVDDDGCDHASRKWGQ